MSYTIEEFNDCHICPQFHKKQGIDINIEHRLRVGVNGFDKDASLETIINEIAIPNSSHIIIKKSPRSKWYVKNISIESARQILSNKTTNYIHHLGAKTYIVSF